MPVTVNLRNNTDLFIKVDGIDEVIVPNTELEDKTIQWVSSENKTIKLFPTVECNTQPNLSGSISFVQNDGIFIERGSLNNGSNVELEADVSELPIIQTNNEGGGKLLEWSLITSETVINLTYNKI